MTPLSPRTQAWKEAEDRKDPYISLYEVSLSDTVTIYMVKGDPLGIGKVTYAGHDYLATKILEDEVEQTITRDLSIYRLTVSNIDGLAGAAMEQYELDGRSIRIVRFASPGGVGAAGVLAPDTADLSIETWTISDQQYTAQAATITFGPPRAMQGQARRRFTRRCGHSWQQRHVEGNLCGYPSDEFEIDTAQDFRAGGDTDAEIVRQFGWRTLNAAALVLADGAWNVDTDAPGELYCETSGTDCEWNATVQGAPYAYKLLDGDFDVSTRTLIYTGREGMSAGILCQSVTDPTSWILLSRAFGDEEDWLLRIAAVLAGVAEPIAYAELDREYLRLARVGDVLSSYSSPDGVTWTTLAIQTLPFGTSVRVGLVVRGTDASQATIAAGWSHFRFAVGGLPACPRTIEGCRLHDNVHRFGGFPGMPVL